MSAIIADPVMPEAPFLQAIQQCLPDGEMLSHEKRFDQLVFQLLDADTEQVAQLAALFMPDEQYARTPECFYAALQQVIRQMNLQPLFCHSSAGDWHRSICPAAYNERTGEHYADEMAKWRSDFRAMSPERQMVAATIIWLYRSGPDSIWLRRVPCAWRAVEALHYLNDAGQLLGWVRLIVCYPGW